MSFLSFATLCFCFIVITVAPKFIFGFSTPHINNSLGISQSSTTTTTTAAAPGIIASMDESFFDYVTKLNLAKINNFILNTTIPGENTSTFEIDSIHFTNFSLENILFSLTAPNKISVFVQNIFAVIPDTNFVVIEGMMRCDGKVRAFIQNTNSTLVMNMTRLSSGDVQLKFVGINIKWGAVEFVHSFSSPMCKFIEKIIEKIIGDINKLIIFIVEKKLPKEIGPVIEEKINTFIKSLPFNYSNGTEIRSKRLLLYMNPIQNVSLRSHQSPQITWRIPFDPFDPFFYKTDFALSITKTSISELIAYLFYNKMLSYRLIFPGMYNSSLIKFAYPKLYGLCSNCHFAFFANVTTIPFLDLRPNNTAIFHIVNGFMSVEMFSPFGSSIPLVELLANITCGVTNVSFAANNVFDFNLTKVYLSLNVIKSNVGPIDSTKLSRQLTALLNYVLVPLFNVQFKGGLLPAHISNPLLNISTFVLNASFDIKM